jgi:hypothetical protein
MAGPGARWQAGDQLEAAEVLMLECAARGEVFNGAGRGRLPGSGGALADVQVRAEVLRHLLAGADWAVDKKGVRLCGVRVAGLLDLEAVAVRRPLWLEDCDLDDPRPVALSFATIPLLVIQGCRIAGLAGNALTIGSNLSLRGSSITSNVVLNGAHIGNAFVCSDALLGGSLALPGARIEGSLQLIGAWIGADEHGESLICNGLDLRLSAHLEGLATDGALILDRAEVGGDVICRGVDIGANDSGISLSGPGARVRGAIYLDSDSVTQGALALAGATIGGQLRCVGARLGADANGDSLIGDGLRTSGSVNLDASPGRPFTADGAIRLAGAEITGSLTCRGGRLGANGYGNALVADELRVSVAVLLEGGFTAAGAVRLAGAQIGGQLRCEGVRLTGADRQGCSLFGDGLKAGGPAHLDGGFCSAGSVVLTGADFGGLLSLAGARIGADCQQRALAADGIRVDRDVIANDAICEGAVALPGAVIGGSLILRQASLNGRDSDGNSLAGGGLRVGGSLDLGRGFHAAGAIVLDGAVIGGALTCEGAQLGVNSRGDALTGEGMAISRDVRLEADDDRGDAFTAHGSVVLSGAQISGFLTLGGALITSRRGRESLRGRGVQVGSSVYLDRGFTTSGSVGLSRARIGGSVACHGARLGAAASGASLICERAVIGGGMILDRGFTAAGSISLSGTEIGRALVWDPAEPAAGQVSLEGTQAQYLTDNWDGSRPLAGWPTGNLRLAGFTYQGFGGDSHASVGQRLDWIRSQYYPTPQPAPTGPPFATQPYRQLADAYRRAGQEDEATTTEIAMRRDLRRYGTLTPPRKALNWLLDITIRYGFQTSRALAGIAILYLAVFAAAVAAQHQSNLITATSLNGASLHPTAERCVTGYPCFYPAGYAFDLVIPLINIHQADYWQPNGHHPYGWAWVFGAWTATALGWFLATLLVVGYSGLARKE